MTYGYSLDLRERVIAYLEEGHTQKEACSVFGVSRKTVYSWLKLKREKGSLSWKRTKGYRVSKYNKLEAELKAYIVEHPDAYLQEIAEVFKGTSSGICRALKRFKISRKKSRFCTENVMRRSAKSF